MATTLRIHPEGEFEIATRIDDDDAMFVKIDLPDRRSGDQVELIFDLPTFVSFADWIEMNAHTLIDENQRRTR